MRIDGSVLRQYREEHKLSREALAAKIDITSKTIQRIENDEPTSETTVKLIEDALGIVLRTKDEFTDAQLRAINSDSYNLKILAGAGAGKTRVVEEIIARLISVGVSPSEMVVCTFTEKAALELRVRTQKRMKQENDGTGVAEIILGTIHGICIRLLQEYTDKYGDFSVLDTMKNIHFINRNFTPIEADKIRKLTSTETMKRYFDSKRFLSICEILGENQVNWDRVPEKIETAYNNYNRLLVQNHYFDFSTIQAVFLKTLRNDEEFRAKIKASIKYLLVDEYQDVNYLQSEIVKEFSSLGVHIIVVGDADQAIYQFRGSDYCYIKDFDNAIGNTELVKLEDNFRSTEGIIQIAESSIVHNTTREDKKMVSRSKWLYENGDIVYKSFDSPDEEATFIADRIEELLSMGMPASEIAVLYRKKKYMQPLIDELRRRNVPMEVENISNLFNTDEIRAIVNAFKYMSGEGTSRNDVVTSFRRLADYLTEGQIADVLRYIDDSKPERWKEKHRSSLNQEYLLQEIYQGMLGCLGLIKDSKGDTRYEQILFNLGKFSQLINDFEVVYYDYSPAIKLCSFVGFISSTRDEYPEGYLLDEYRKVQGVQIMTVHKSKGLQFSAVFVPTLCQNIFPSQGKGGLSEWHYLPEEAIINAAALRAKGQRALEDERRVFYVAVTRSRKFLFLTYALHYTEKTTAKRSTFLNEALNASGFIYEYDDRLCDYKSRPKWKPVSTDPVTFKVDFTDLSDFFDCDYSFKLSKIYGFVSPINIRMGYGASIHNMAKEINKYVLENKTATIPPEKLQDILDGFYLPFVGNASMIKEVLFEKAAKCIKKYTVENASKFSEVEYVEKYIEVPLRDDILVSGRIDLIRKKDIGGKWHVIIVDYKTGNKVPTPLEQRLQLEIYALGYKQLTGSNADVMEIVDIEGNEVISSRAVINDNLVETQDMIEKACDTIIEGKFNPKTCDEKKCKNCSQKGMCFVKR